MDYCIGLLLPGERKSVEPMAAIVAPARRGGAWRVNIAGGWARRTTARSRCRSRSPITMWPADRLAALSARGLGEGRQAKTKDARSRGRGISDQAADRARPDRGRRPSADASPARAARAGDADQPRIHPGSAARDRDARRQDRRDPPTVGRTRPLRGQVGAPTLHEGRSRQSTVAEALSRGRTAVAK